MTTDSLKVTDEAAAAVATKPRVKLQDIEDAISFELGTTGDKMAVGTPGESMEQLKILSVRVLVMKNGFTVMGKSAPASPENFNADLGQKFAREDAIRQLWPLMGYALRDQLDKAA